MKSICAVATYPGNRDLTYDASTHVLQLRGHELMPTKYDVHIVRAPFGDRSKPRKPTLSIVSVAEWIRRWLAGPNIAGSSPIVDRIPRI